MIYFCDNINCTYHIPLSETRVKYLNVLENGRQKVINRNAFYTPERSYYFCDNCKSGYEVISGLIKNHDYKESKVLKFRDMKHLMSESYDRR